MAGTSRPRVIALAAVLGVLPATVTLAQTPTGAGSPAWVDGARIALVSAPLLGRPYRLDPLGEGEDADIDRDPLWRTDVFDCLTFVETVIALARAADDPAARVQLQQVRYAQGRVGFATRNHFPDADWIPNNLQAGIVGDVTTAVAQAAGLSGQLRHATGVVRRADWLRGLRRNPLQAANPRFSGRSEPQVSAAIAALAAAAQDAPVDLPYLRLREQGEGSLRAMIDTLPDGAVVFIVRPNTSLLGPVGAVTQLSHVGFALRDARGSVMFRNASSGHARRVQDVPLLPYLQRMQTTRSFAGIVVLRVRLPAGTPQIP